jgi:hypothetical protein
MNGRLVADNLDRGQARTVLPDGVADLVWNHELAVGTRSTT